MRDLVLIPGLNNTDAIFDPIRAALGPVARIHTHTSPPLDTVEAVAEAWLADAPERFHLCGFSFGGYVSAAILELAPERVTGLCFLCTAPHADSEAVRAIRRSAIAEAEAGRYETWLEGTMAANFHPDTLAARPELIEARRAMVREYGAARFIAHQRACIARPDRTAVAAAWRGPSAIIAASHDQTFPPQMMRELHEKMPEARFTMIEGAGHLAPLEKPAEIAAALRDWLA